MTVKPANEDLPAGKLGRFTIILFVAVMLVWFTGLAVQFWFWRTGELAALDFANSLFSGLVLVGLVFVISVQLWRLRRQAILHRDELRLPPEQLHALRRESEAPSHTGRRGR